MMKPKVTDFSQLDLSKTYTYADYLSWQFSERVELIKGWIYKSLPRRQAGARHRGERIKK